MLMTHDHHIKRPNFEVFIRKIKNETEMLISVIFITSCTHCRSKGDGAAVPRITDSLILLDRQVSNTSYTVMWCTFDHSSEFKG